MKMICSVKKLSTLLRIFLMVCMAITQSSCIVAAIGAGVGAVKYGNSKKTAAQAKTMESYNEYALGMQKINIERESKHLPPEKVMTYKEYCGSN